MNYNIVLKDISTGVETIIETVEAARQTDAKRIAGRGPGGWCDAKSGAQLDGEAGAGKSSETPGASRYGAKLSEKFLEIMLTVPKRDYIISV